MTGVLLSHLNNQKQALHLQIIHASSAFLGERWFDLAVGPFH